ncbi:hypothetical protein IAU60_006628 [Kwoniella sp. DSM 27419]
MFFSDDLLTSKKGSFGIIWLMATLGPKNKKITRRQLTSVDLPSTCELIAQPPEPMALRLSGALLVGVARCYNQNYELFFSDVSNFHSNLRRSLVTDVAASSSGPNGNRGTGMDLSSEGKSRHDQITFSTDQLDLTGAFDYEFLNVDWSDPFGAVQKGRSSTKLSTQDTATSEEEEEADVDYTNEEEGSQYGRQLKQRAGTGSSPFGAAYTSGIKNRISIHHPSDRTSPGLYGSNGALFEAEIDLGLDLDFDGGLGGANDSFSGPSGRGMEAPLAGDFNMADTNMEGAPIAELRLPASGLAISDLGRPGENADPSSGSALHKRRHNRHRFDSAEDAENQLRASKRRHNRVKKASLDNTLELEDEEEHIFRRRYRHDMDEKRRALVSRSRDQALEKEAQRLVDGGFLANLKSSDLGSPGHNDEGLLCLITQSKTLIPHIRMSVFVRNISTLSAYPVEQVFQEFEIPIQEMSASARPGTDQNDVELLRRASQGSQHPLPWEDRSRSVTPGQFQEMVDASVSPTSLRLSVMTPQEVKLRSRSLSGSTVAPQLNQRNRVRSSSLISDRADDDPLLLITASDLELPPDDDTENSLPPLGPSQLARLRDLPEAFAPQILATLERQCRDFFTFVERRMLKQETDTLGFDDLVPTQGTKRVAAHAFYNCLTLATKGIVTVRQSHEWGPFDLRFAVKAA